MSCGCLIVHENDTLLNEYNAYHNTFKDANAILFAKLEQGSRSHTPADAHEFHYVEMNWYSWNGVAIGEGRFM